MRKGLKIQGILSDGQSGGYGPRNYVLFCLIPKVGSFPFTNLKVWHYLLHWSLFWVPTQVSPCPLLCFVVMGPCSVLCPEPSRVEQDPTNALRAVGTQHHMLQDRWLLASLHHHVALGYGCTKNLILKFQRSKLGFFLLTALRIPEGVALVGAWQPQMPFSFHFQNKPLL